MKAEMSLNGSVEDYGSGEINGEGVVLQKPNLKKDFGGSFLLPQ